ncbi:MAG TPA: TraB/GumN family protein [Flavisolibacter sp.]|nr:TraB/GumN family protein [Flavisolibacter sp.]
MKKLFWFGLVSVFGFAAYSQPSKKTPAANNTLLWKITGKDLTKPSYLFGTMHMLCADDIQLSDSLNKAIQNADDVYLELDMDNLFEMMGAITKMKMRNDTTLADLLSTEEYQKVKQYFTENSKLIPFNMLETYKPLLAASMIMEQQVGECDNMISMEQLVMKESKKNGVAIKGMESMEYQMAIFDSIPYSFQAKQLVKMVEEGNSDGSEMKKITEVYRSQLLDQMEELTKKEDMGISNFADLLLYNRNRDWAKKMQSLMSKASLVVAVGAGHLPGEKGVINLLRKAGYKVEPVVNNMIRKKVKEI